jgi:hypothetical protein
VSLWRIQIAMPDDPYGQELLTSVLARQRVWALLLSQRDTEMTADVLVELPRDGALGALLSELHMTSSQVLVSSADQPSSLASTRSLRTGAQIRSAAVARINSSGCPA